MKNKIKSAIITLVVCLLGAGYFCSIFVDEGKFLLQSLAILFLVIFVGLFFLVARNIYLRLLDYFEEKESKKHCKKNL